MWDVIKPIEVGSIAEEMVGCGSVTAATMREAESVGLNLNSCAYTELSYVCYARLGP